MNVPVVELAGTTIDVGAVRTEAALLVIVTVLPPPPPDPSDKVTVHDVPLFEERLELVQARDTTDVVWVCAITCNDTLATTALPFNAADINTVWFVEKLPVERLNAAVVALAGTVNVAGIFTADGDAVLVSVSKAPPACAGRDNVAVHVLF